MSHPLLKMRKQGGMVYRSDLLSFLRQRFKFRDPDPSPLLPQVLEHFVASNLEKPSIKAIPLQQSSDPLIHGEQHVLSQFFGSHLINAPCQKIPSHLRVQKSKQVAE